MKKWLIVSVTVLFLVGLMFYLLVRSATSVTHIHFNNRDGVLQSVIYYSERPPELSSQHECDERFADMRDDLYRSHLQVWREKYGEMPP